MLRCFRPSPALRYRHRNVVVSNAAADAFPDVLTPEAVNILSELAPLDRERRILLAQRHARRLTRIDSGKPPTFLDPSFEIPRRGTVADIRAGKFEGGAIPEDLQRQWVQGTGPAVRPRASLEQNLRSVGYALLSGADGWMFDGEDAQGQTGTMSLDAQRSLKTAFAFDPKFVNVCEKLTKEMNAWSETFHGEPLFTDLQKQLQFTTRIYRARGLHLDDRHIRSARDGSGFSASITDAVLYVLHNHKTLLAQGRSVVLYLPKIQHVLEASLWDETLSALEELIGLPNATIRTYVLVEQLEASYQLLEIRAALGKRFVGFNTGRWDYINSVADCLAGTSAVHPNISEVTMKYAYMAAYEDRVRRAVNTPDALGQFALWQGGMEPQIPVGSQEGVTEALRRAVVGAQREQEAGASGKWVAHWKMVRTIRAVWEKAGQPNQLGREFPKLSHTEADSKALTNVAKGPRTIEGARDLISVALQYANAFERGFQAAALKPADFFGNDDVLYLMEDMATGEIRVSILWEWLHKSAVFTKGDAATGVREGDAFTKELFARLVDEEYEKLLGAKGVDVHEDSKATTLPIAKQIVLESVSSPVKYPWFADLLNLCLDVEDLAVAKERIAKFKTLFAADGTRITENLNFSAVRAMATHCTEGTMSAALRAAEEYMSSPRFDGVKRVYTAREVAEQRGSFTDDYTVARDAAQAFHMRLRELFRNGETILTFGPYSPGQVVAMKKAGIEGVYLGGWATSAKGSREEDPGPDLASYPLGQVPTEGGHLVRALMVADKNQWFQRSRMSAAERAGTPETDFRPFIIADADTGHGGDAHVRNLIRRFVENGIPGYHIEDQKPGVKKCGHQGGKVLVSSEEQIKRVNAARFQLDLMGVPGIIVARTDAEAASLLDGRGDERDQPFILGATNTQCPTFRVATLALIKTFFDSGVTSLAGHQLFAVCDDEMVRAEKWMDSHGIRQNARDLARKVVKGQMHPEGAMERGIDHLVRVWQDAAGIMTYTEAVAAVMEMRIAEGEPIPMSTTEWLKWASGKGWYETRRKAREFGCDAPWDCEHAKTPDGYYQVRGGLEFAIQKSLAVAPYTDLLWMETKTANLDEAAKFARAIHAVYPDKMLAYNMSPSFNWDTTGMSDDEMRQFHIEMGKLGFVFNFITYGGHQIDGAAGEEFAASLKQDGMLALAKLQRKFRLLESPYRTPQSLVGGPRADAGLSAVTGFTATTKAMGQGSTQHQHLVQVEVPTKLLEGWLARWKEHHGVECGDLTVKLRPFSPGSDILELSTFDGEQKVANVVFNIIEDRKRRRIVSIRDQNNFAESLRQKRLMTLLHLFLIHRYNANTIHYVDPTNDNKQLSQGLLRRNIFSDVKDEIGGIIVAIVDKTTIERLVAKESKLLKQIITK
eukprot:TRINITY_DN56300_c0_g1_i1.p1 TRINITY_DN56300_c0_g1~~TRINITY_DN56300_c0_g1_i1.p1  ORF type:complete len:1398 (-),score=445.34 TRINITY_DN56300_c0_g1_i1:415-4608(-)